MDELIKTFHIEVNLLVAQIVNFFIVLLVLYKFAYKPVLKTLNSRTKKIEKGLQDADEAGKKLEEILEKEKMVLAEAKKEAQNIIKMSEEKAQSNAQNILAETRAESDKLLVTAKNQIEQEKQKMLLEIKEEIADLVILATEKIVLEKMNQSTDREIIKKVISEK